MTRPHGLTQILRSMQKKCKRCGERFYPSHGNQKYCPRCQGDYKIKL